MKMMTLMFLVVALISGCSGHFKKVSAAVEDRYNPNHVNSSDITFHDIRQKLYRMDKLDFLIQADTVFMLESFHVEDAGFYGKIWTGIDTIQYRYRNKQFEFDVLTSFSPFMTNAISKWDTTAIRENERLYSDMNPVNNVVGIKIVHYKNNPRIDIIRFREFFNLNRDRHN